MKKRTSKLLSISLSALLLIHMIVMGGFTSHVSANTTQSLSVTMTYNNAQPYDGSFMTAHPVTITASSTNNKAIEYSKNYGVVWQPYTGAITVSDVGVHHYLFREVGTIPIKTANVHIMPAPAQQAITTSPDSIYYVNADVQTSGDGTSWGSAFKDLQEALDEAAENRVSNGDSVHIYIAEGTYKPSVRAGETDPRNAYFQLQNNVAIYGGFSGNGNERDIQNYPTILSGDLGTQNVKTDNVYHVFYHPTGTNLNDTAVLDGVIIRDGNANGGSDHASGGGMYNDGSSPTLTNVTMSGNTASSGGGMSNTGSSSPTLTNVTMSGNTATSGGGMFNENSSPTLTNVTMSGNTATSIYSYGGGMSNTGSSSPTLTNVTISGNTASAAISYGGGMYNYNASSSPTLTNVTMSGNTATAGGGMYNVGSSPTLTNVTMSGNTANSGGGMYNENSSPTLTNVTISGNRASSGGGMSNTGSSSPTLTNVTMSGNTAISNGGGMYNEYYSGPTLTNVTMSGNKSNGTAGTIYGGTPTIQNSIIIGNNNEPALAIGTTSTIANSLLDVEVENETTVGKLHTTGGNVSTETYQPAEIFIDPSKQDYRLRANSIAIGTGDNDKNTTPTDLAGNTRIQGTIDLGAYESSFYRLKYVANGGTGNVPQDPLTYASGDTITVKPADNSFTRTGYTFTGWNTALDGSGSSYPENATFQMDATNGILYAQWALNSYTVSFDPQGGAAVGSQTVQHNEKATDPPTPTKAGYTFTGWYHNGIVWDFNTPVVSDMTLTAGWQAIPSSGGGGGGYVPTPIPVQPPSNTETIEVEIVDPNDPTKVYVKTKVARKTENGRVTDTVEFTNEQAAELVKQLAGQQGTATIVLPPQPDTDETFIDFSQEALALLAENGVQVMVSMDNVQLQLPVASLAQMTEDVTFKVTPLQEELDAFVEDAQNAPAFANAMTVRILGQPVRIETNIQGVPVILTLPVDGDFAEEDLYAYIAHSDGTTEVKQGRLVAFSPGVKGFQFEVDHFSVFGVVHAPQKEEELEPPVEPEPPIEPEPEMPIEEEPVVLAPYIQGYPNGTFKPNANVSRAEMALMLARFMTNDEILVADATFTDTEKHYAKDAIEVVKASGFFKGKTSTVFDPDGAITRAEMATVVVRWMEETCAEDASKSYCEQVNAEKAFTDVAATHWASEAIQKANMYGVMTGKAATIFDPNGTLIRAEAVKVLNRLFARPVLAEVTKSRFTDVPVTHWALQEIETAATEIIVE